MLGGLRWQVNARGGEECRREIAFLCQLTPRLWITAANYPDLLGEANLWRLGTGIVSLIPAPQPKETDTLNEGPCAFAASNASIDSMATLTIRQLDERTKTRLRVRAAHHGRSMEEEAREILRSALTVPSLARRNLAESIHRRFAEVGGIELELPERDTMREPPGFGK
jgi:plasmid stability protein